MTESRLIDIDRSMQLLSGKWKVQILCLMQSGPIRLGQLTRSLPHASKKVLAEQLRELVLSGIVERKDLGGSVKHVEYDFREEVRECMHSILNHLGELGRFYRTDIQRKVEPN